MVIFFTLSTHAVQTPFSHKVSVYNMEHNLRFVGSRYKLKFKLSKAHENNIRSPKKNKNLRELIRYARLFHVEKNLGQYLEVVL